VTKDKELKLSWRIYLRLCSALALKIPRARYDVVAGVPRGGYIPACIIAHELELPIVDVHTAVLHRRALLVADLVDTGKTLMELAGLCDTAVIFRKPWSQFASTYWVRETSRWVVFPYEKESQ